jgi:GR25 family glycosyltransferase involved in LPS biosynthesis
MIKMFNTYVINLDSQPGRWNAQSKELAKVGINPIRIKGILNEDNSTNKYHSFIGRKISLYKGSTSSHIKACENFIQNDANDFALILEDDAYPSFNNVKILEEYLKTCYPYDFDMLLVHCDGWCPTKDKQKSHVSSGSVAAYFITKEGAKKLVNHKFSTLIDFETNIITNFKKIVSGKNFFWTDEEYIMSNDISNNRVYNNQKNDNIVDKIMTKLTCNRGEKTWRHIKNFKNFKIPIINYTLKPNHLIIILLIILFFIIKKFRPKIF